MHHHPERAPRQAPSDARLLRRHLRLPRRHHDHLGGSSCTTTTSRNSSRWRWCCGVHSVHALVDPPIFRQDTVRAVVGLARPGRRHRRRINKAARTTCDVRRAEHHDDEGVRGRRAFEVAADATDRRPRRSTSTSAFAFSLITPRYNRPPSPSVSAAKKLLASLARPPSPSSPTCASSSCARASSDDDDSGTVRRRARLLLLVLLLLVPPSCAAREQLQTSCRGACRRRGCSPRALVDLLAVDRARTSSSRAVGLHQSPSPAAAS